MSLSIQESCSCGANFVFTDSSSGHLTNTIQYEHTKFLNAHKDCRTRAIISNGKELKMFLAKTDDKEKKS